MLTSPLTALSPLRPLASEPPAPEGDLQASRMPNSADCAAQLSSQQSTHHTSLQTIPEAHRKARDSLSATTAMLNDTPRQTL